MNKSDMKLAEVARSFNLRFDSNASAIFGNYRGYDVCIVKTPAKVFQVSVNVVGSNQNPHEMDFNQFNKDVKEITSVFVKNGGEVVFLTAGGISENGTLEKLQIALEKICETLRVRGLRNVCAGCMQEIPTTPYLINGNGLHFCDECFNNVRGAIGGAELKLSQKKENVAFGIVGALLGSLVGVAAIVIIGQLGYVAAISGFILAVATLMGYEKFAGKSSKKGALISIVIMAVMVYVGNHADWAFVIAREFEADFFESFMAVNEVIALAGVESDYYMNLGLIALFTIIGSLGTIIAMFKNPTKKSAIHRLTQDNY